MRLVPKEIEDNSFAGVDFSQLGRSEFAVATLVGLECRNREIGRILGLTEGTIKEYLNSIFCKLGVSDRLELSSLVNDLSQEFAEARRNLVTKNKKDRSRHSN
jgi:DNA-binding NarL/FixJ family response regulator